jgi:dTDP-4-dehydrorhamnose reductase
MRALVVGADALVGRALAEALRTRGDEVVGTTRRAERVVLGETMLLDLAAPEPVIADLPDADVAFLCAAMTRFADCRASPELAERVNFRAPVALAAQLLDRGTRPILLSTSAVLDGQAPKMAADRPRLGKSAYGRWKGEAESAILGLDENATVVRLTKILTPGMPLFETWLRALKAGSAISAFDGHRIAPIELHHAVEALLATADRGNGGIYQVSGAEDVSYHEIACHLAKRIGALPSLVQAASAADTLPLEEITAHTSLDTGRLTELSGFTPPEPLEVLDRVV